MAFVKAAGLAIGMVLIAAHLYAAPQGQTEDTSKRLYDRVMEEYTHRDYEAALAGFRLFMELHSQSVLAANAQYWIGECQYRLGRYKDALTTFYNVISYYPLSSKLAASTLKIGQAYSKLGDREKARMMFERVIEQYPESLEAGVARKTIEVPANKNERLPRMAEDTVDETPRGARSGEPYAESSSASPNKADRSATE
jgi:tol-pal system protein YbgF